LFYCRISLFTEQTASQLEAELIFNIAKTTRGIIIDLRNNPGGLLEAAISCAALFVEKNSLIVSTKNLHGKTMAHYHTQRHPLIKPVPLVLLVNRTTASAAEIFAQALRIYAAQAAKGPFVTIVGTRTAGKGSLQKIRPLYDTYALKITTAVSYMADGTTFNAQGIKPDFSLPEAALNESIMLDHFTELPKKSVPTHKKNLLALLNINSSDSYITCACSLIALISHVHTYTPHLVSTYPRKLSWLKAHYILPNPFTK
ncbi:hypothetical protein H0W26_02225, partial [Candidatus Dependentiae bacterium]|nr:hypothetical protein [Candidatus Dependentiae bacterium]